MRVRAVVAVCVTTFLMLAACGNTEKKSDSGGGGDGGGGNGEQVTVDQPGVTDTEIRVGGIASVTNPLGGKYGDAFNGVKAYFDMVNAEGGIYGRNLVLASERDDQLLKNKETVEAMLAQDNVFAVLPVAVLVFTGAQTLQDQGVPTFGWNINPEYADKDHLFGHITALCLGCELKLVPWLAQKIKAPKVAIYAYGTSEQSRVCAEGFKKSFEKYETAEVVAYDDTLPFGGGGPTDSQVQEAGEKGAKLFVTCTDQNGVKSLAEKIKKYGIDAVQYMPNAYDAQFMAANAEIFEGSYVYTAVLPLETEPQPPALQQFTKWMDKAGYEKTENALVGWINAAMFVAGLEAAGPDFTRQKVVDALNEMTDFDAGGLVPPLDWTTGHQDPTNDPSVAPDEDCSGLLRVTDGKFEIPFQPTDKPFVCFPWEGPLGEPTFAP